MQPGVTYIYKFLGSHCWSSSQPMKRAGLKDPLYSFPSRCLWSLFEVKETSTQRKAPQGNRSDEDEVLCAPVGIFGTEETEQREEGTLETWSRGLCCLLLLNSVNDPVIFSEAEKSLQSQPSGFTDNSAKKSCFCLELDSWWSQFECLTNWEMQNPSQYASCHALFLKELGISTERIESQKGR